jgi:hypothetical protein
MVMTEMTDDDKHAGIDVGDEDGGDDGDDGNNDDGNGNNDGGGGDKGNIHDGSNDNKTATRH